MINIKYSVTFRPDSFVRPDSSRSLRIVVCWKGIRVSTCLPVAVFEDQWDSVSMSARATKAHKNAKAVNEVIYSSRSKMTDIFQAAAIENRIPSRQEVKDALTGRTSEYEEPIAEEPQEPEQPVEETNNTEKSIGEKKDSELQAEESVEQADMKPLHSIRRTITEFVVDQTEERAWVPVTAKKFYTLREDLLKAGLRYVEEMDGDGVKKFIKSLGKRELQNAVLMKKAAHLRWFLNWCYQKGYLDNEDYKRNQPHLKCPQKEVIYLTWEELLQLYYFNYGPHEALERTRDVFCFCAFTGLRFSDAKRLKWANVHDTHIRIVTQKTSDALKIELNKYSRAIIEKYRPQGIYAPEQLVLPAISLQKSNEHLKDCAMLAQIDEMMVRVSYIGNRRIEKNVLKWELITTHCARRTFVVNALRLGIAAEVIMKWTGHSDFKAMKPYVAIVDELKEESMARFDKA